MASRLLRRFAAAAAASGGHEAGTRLDALAAALAAGGAANAAELAAELARLKPALRVRDAEEHAARMVATLVEVLPDAVGPGGYPPEALAELVADEERVVERLRAHDAPAHARLPHPATAALLCAKRERRPDPAFGVLGDVSALPVAQNDRDGISAEQAARSWREEEPGR